MDPNIYDKDLTASQVGLTKFLTVCLSLGTNLPQFETLAGGTAHKIRKTGIWYLAKPVKTGGLAKTAGASKVHWE
jgi:hypothetical protein